MYFVSALKECLLPYTFSLRKTLQLFFPPYFVRVTLFRPCIVCCETLTREKKKEMYLVVLLRVVVFLFLHFCAFCVVVFAPPCGNDWH